MYNYMDVGKACLKKMSTSRPKELTPLFNSIFLALRGKRNCTPHNKKKKNSTAVVRPRADNRNRT
jgi:hypothetical protein